MIGIAKIIKTHMYTSHSWTNQRDIKRCKKCLFLKGINEFLGSGNGKKG